MRRLDDLSKKISELEAAIEKLPAGYISRKNINGIPRSYYQWTEEGKKKSQYLREEQAVYLAEKIEGRKQLQQELKQAKLQVAGTKKQRKAAANTDAAADEYSLNILTGERLRYFAEKAKELRSRPCLEQLKDYLDMERLSRVFILYGLRRTGKTTLIQQAIASMEPDVFEKTAFIQICQGDTLAKLNQDLKKLQQKGFRYVFLDEVTLLEDFIEGAALFSDIYAASGMKIVLSGTDSLGFVFSADEQLYDRCLFLHTTFISYGEFETVLGRKGIDEYIRYGGTMSLGGVHYNETSTFATKESTDEYVDSAIARNIQHSLRYYRDAGHFRHLQDLYDHQELTSAINRVVEDINHRFTIEVMTADFTSHDLGLSARNLRMDREEPTDILDRIDREQFTMRLKAALEIRNKPEQTVEITQAHRTEIREYLDLLDLTVDIPTETLPVANEKGSQTVISQPGLRYAQAQELVRQLLRDKAFSDISAPDRKRVLERILDEIRGRMMEEIVLLETQRAFPGKEVFKLRFAVGEFDMVICDPEELTCALFEIKHSRTRDPRQYRHLIDRKKCEDTAFRFGEITGRYVIYRGETGQEGEISYLNVEEYLMKIGSNGYIM